MNCERFRDAIVGDDPAALAAAEQHAIGCDDCRQLLLGDRELAREVEAWKESSPSPPATLEQRIAAAIDRAPRQATTSLPRRAAWVALAASLIIVIWAGFQLRSPGGETPTSTSTPLEQAIAQADQARDQYLRSIAELERRATPLLERASDPEMAPAEAATVLRYRDRLMHLDSVIAEVRGFLDENPGHSSGHAVLLAAYQEKQQVLMEILQIHPGDAS